MSEYRDEFNRVQGEAYWSLPRVLLGIFAFLMAMYVIGFLVTGGDLAIYKFWAPKQENARRQVFENTQSYVEGKIQAISQERLAYENAAPGSSQQSSLRTMIISEASTVDNSKLPPDLQAFISRLKGAF